MRSRPCRAGRRPIRTGERSAARRSACRRATGHRARRPSRAPPNSVCPPRRSPRCPASRRRRSAGRSTRRGSLRARPASGLRRAGASRRPSTATGIRRARFRATASRPCSFRAPPRRRSAAPGRGAGSFAAVPSCRGCFGLQLVLLRQGTHGGAALFGQGRIGPVLQHHAAQRFEHRGPGGHRRVEPQRAPAVAAAPGAPFAGGRLLSSGGPGCRCLARWPG